MAEILLPVPPPGPCVVVHGMEHAAAAVDAAGRVDGRGVVLLSARSAASFAGIGWWLALVGAARARRPDLRCSDLLDCGDSAARALEALRLGQRGLVLHPPGEDGSAAGGAVEARRNLLLRARTVAATVLGERPPALDLADPGAMRRLRDWLDRPARPGAADDAP